MLNMYDKEGKLKSIVEHDDVKYIAQLGFNTNSSKIQIELDIPDFADKGAFLVIGTHNTVPFMSYVYVKHNNENAVIKNIVNSVNVTSISSYEDKVVVRMNTETYGTCSIFSSVPILDAFYTN